MKTLSYLPTLILFILLVSACNNKFNNCNNEKFIEAIDNYCKYLDSLSYKRDNDYIYVEARKFNDSTVFIITLGGGSYDFIYKRNRIIDFFTYNGYDILLIGDFPNEILNIKKNKKLNVIEDIVKKKYLKDYNKYLQDEHSVAPLIYDYMNMTLIFKGNKLISSKRQYY